MIRRPPRSTRTDTLFPYTTLFRSITCIAYATDTQTAALTQRVIHQALMLADHAAAVIDDLTRIGLQVRGKKFAEFALADEADAGRVLLAMDRQSRTRCDCPHLGFAQVAERKQHARSEERRVGKEWVSTCRSRGSPYHKT